MSQHVSRPVMPVISEAAFSGLFGRLVNQLDRYTEGAKVGVLVSLMAGFSAYIGHGPTVETGKGESPLAFWPVLCGPSGLGRKGTATGIAMRVISTAFQSFAEDNTVYGLPATGLGFISELDERATGGTANPVLFIEEEMDSFIGAARRDAKVGVYLRKAWDGMTLAHKTKTDDIRVRKPHLGIVGHCQPKNWAAIRGSKDATGGTYNRFMPVYVYQSKTLPVFQSIDSTNVIRDCARALRSAADFARQVDTVSVPLHVAEAFEAKHRPIVEALTNSSEELSQYCERAMAYMVRLAALYALADKREEISVRDFDAALALVSYSVETVSFILPEAEINDETSMAVKVESFIRDAGENGVNSTEIYRHFAIKASELREIVAELETVEATQGEGSGRGRKPIIYKYIGAPEASEMASEEIDEIEEMEMPAPEIVPAEEISEPVSILAPLSDDEWDVIDTPPTAPEPVAPAVVPVLSDDEWEEIDAALSATPEPESAPEPEPVEQAPAEPAVSKEAVMAYLASPEGAEILQGILAGMLAGSAPQSAPEAPAKAVKIGQAGTKVVPPAMFVSAA